MSEKVVTGSEDGVLLRIKVVPNSDSFRINDVNKWRKRLKVKLESSPSKGRANEELLEEMENILGKKVNIKSGTRSRKKTLYIQNISTEKVYKGLGIEEP